VLLFQKRFHEGLVSGSITLSFRIWPKARVKPGGRYRCHPIGVVEVDSMDRIRVAAIGDADARRAGFADRESLLEYMRKLRPDLDEGTEVFRIGLHYGGDGDRASIALDDRLAPEDVQTVSAKLKKLDAVRPWTAETLALILRNPRVAASQLAKQAGREKAAFKADVVKLKKLGLTQSFEVGYEISPRGGAYLRALARGGAETPKTSKTAKAPWRKRRNIPSRS
jgi:hypothetical protein